MAKAKKKSALAVAASRRLQMIGAPKLNEEQVAHMMYHAEERGEVQRTTLEDGSWAWIMPAQPDGKRPILKPTGEMLAHLERFARGEGHNHG